MFKDLDPVLHSQLRLAVISLLITLEEAEFTYLKEKTGASSGNLSVQLDKLKTEGYIEINKSFRNNYPLTVCRITKKGINAFEKYVDHLKSYINPKNK
jgi:DNA-binding MarR family transcriptional regulator